MKYLAIVIATFGLISCSSSKKKEVAKDIKVEIRTDDVMVSGGIIKIPIAVKCIPGNKEAVLQLGNFYKTFPCEEEAGGFKFVHEFPSSKLKKNREKRKDYVLRIRAYHPDKKKETLSQSLVVISYKDYQSKLVINQSILQMKDMEGVFSDLMVYGQCRQGSRIEVEVFDDWRGVSLEEEVLNCGEAGFNYYTRRPGQMRKGTRLLIREMIEKKPLASYEVVLFH